MINLIRSRWFLAGLGLVVMVYLLIFRWSALNQLEKRQEAFFDAFERAKWGQCEDLIAATYTDPWRLNRETVLLVMKDVRSQFIALEVTLRERQIDLTGEVATLTGFLSVEGRGFGVAALAESRLDRLESPFTFTWRKQSIWPWSWRLTSISHPDLEMPEGYQPGELLRARREGMGF